MSEEGEREDEGINALIPSLSCLFFSVQKKVSLSLSLHVLKGLLFSHHTHRKRKRRKGKERRFLSSGLDESSSLSSGNSDLESVKVGGFGSSLLHVHLLGGGSLGPLLEDLIVLWKERGGGIRRIEGVKFQ